MTPRILFLLHLPPPVHGSSMVGKWIKESSVINNTFACRYINLLASKKVSESGKITILKLWGMLTVCILLFKQLIKQKPELCYLALTTTGAALYRDLLLVSILKLFGVKRVYHLHNKGIAKAANKPLNKWVYRFVFKNASVILLSEYLYKDIKEFVPRNRVEICPNGIPDVDFSLLIKKRGKPIVLFLSNLIESKGVFVLLKAMRILKEKNIEFNGVFVGGEGDIDAQQFKEKLEEFNLQNQVSYLGRKFGKEKEEIFKSADIFAFPTYYSNECFPLVLIEAMQHKLAIVATNEGGIMSMIDDGESGFLIKQKNIQMLANKLQILIEQPEIRLKMGENANFKYKNEFTLANFEANLVSILNKTISLC
ncbi:Glycosyltransferase involved in cell wall bisynthesis [Flavobacterium degerlachei]|uniref:Glycosyltransferase involved in cell wall bisynthesis n=2 Tax=Flavobacterium degerlachei TaxID=229203 RepID=A0A1H2VP00_9FLAO|nr:Glycosyltransferase involved in cell wall bisynthesis [Flavobacterium degerlachei]